MQSILVINVDDEQMRHGVMPGVYVGWGKLDYASIIVRKEYGKHYQDRIHCFYK